MEMIKIVWKDSGKTKIAKGNLIEEDNFFITVASERGDRISVSKSVIISIKRSNKIFEKGDKNA
ncbi:hypothetical protein HOA92_00045 [archaeon]|jgi:hypothetical protein|nr:hypothetical protein [archaeon]MBT6761410.1 hypothetical protein [archaeon]